MNGPPPGLPPAVVAWLDLERRAAAAPAGARERVAARLGLRVMARPAPPPGPAPLPRRWAPALLWGILLVVVAGGGGLVAVRMAAPRPAPPPVEVHPAAQAVLPRPPAPTSGPPASAADSPVPADPTEAAPPGRGARRETEVAVLRRARAALSRGEAGVALAAVERHRRRWPRGWLSQEREVLAIQALGQAGRVADARARADRFLERFPGSILAAAVRQARERLPVAAPAAR